MYALMFYRIIEQVTEILNHSTRFYYENIQEVIHTSTSSAVTVKKIHNKDITVRTTSPLSVDDFGFFSLVENFMLLSNLFPNMDHLPSFTSYSRFKRF